MINLEAIRRIAQVGLPVMPSTTLELVERCAQAEQRVASLEHALTRYTNDDSCEYGDGPPCPGDWAVLECCYCQGVQALRQAVERHK